MNELSYLPATLEDVPLIFEQCKILVDRFEDTQLIEYDKVLAWLKRKIEGNILQYTCVWSGEQKVAFYRTNPVENLLELDDLYVLPNFRGKGIGSSILKRCIAESTKPLFLYVFRGNTRAVSFYRRHGFVDWQQVSATRFTMIRHT